MHVIVTNEVKLKVVTHRHVYCRKRGRNIGIFKGVGSFDLESEHFQCFNYRNELDSKVQLPKFRLVRS